MNNWDDIRNCWCDWPEFYYYNIRCPDCGKIQDKNSPEDNNGYEYAKANGDTSQIQIRDDTTDKDVILAADKDIDCIVTKFLGNNTFPDKDRTPLKKHVSDITKLLITEVNCKDKTAIVAAKIAGIKTMMLDIDFCRYLRKYYGEDIYNACYQIATYDYHDSEVDCVCQDLRCHGKTYGRCEMWICFCNASGTNEWSVSKSKSDCRKDEILEMCLKKRRKRKLTVMGVSAKVALLGWMIVMVRKFKVGNAPVDWDKVKVDNYLQELLEMCYDLGIQKEDILNVGLASHPSNRTIMYLCSIFLEEFENVVLGIVF